MWPPMRDPESPAEATYPGSLRQRRCLRLPRELYYTIYHTILAGAPGSSELGVLQLRPGTLRTDGAASGPCRGPSRRLGLRVLAWRALRHPQVPSRPRGAALGALLFGANGPRVNLDPRSHWHWQATGRC
jgi:hypothetical protein